MKAKGWLILVVSVLLFLYGCSRIVTNEKAKSYPPVSCQLLGGSWNIWDGWKCG